MVPIAASLVAQRVKASAYKVGREGLLEKAMAPHSRTLAWRIPRMEGPGGLQSLGPQRVGRD